MLPLLLLFLAIMNSCELTVSWLHSYTLAAQADALAATMDGPVGVNSALRGHNTSQYDTWEPGVGVYHRPGRGESRQSCCGGTQLALCGADPALVENVSVLRS